MKNIFLMFLFSIIITSCKENKKETIKNSISEIETFNDIDYVVNNNFSEGDVRRYGIFPDSAYSKVHPFTKMTKLETVLKLSADHNIEMIFPEGHYAEALIIEGKDNISLKFENAEFGGVIQIIDDESIESSNINFKGRLTTYSGFFTRKSSNISVEDLIIKTDISKNIYDLRSRGCQIYAGTKNIKINNLIIEDLGSGNEKYTYASSALAIEGWNNNPENVQIKKIHIKSTDRHGIYITGEDHLIDEVIIERFGVGSAIDMAPMQDAQKGEETEFKALWINKCYNSFIEKITINEQGSKGKYTAHFDYGDKSRPFTIGVFKVINDNPNINILEEDPNGVIIEQP